MLIRAALYTAICAFGAIWTAWAAPILAAEANPRERLSFDVAEGKSLNSFLREGTVAAHLVLRSGQDPRILVAFPAGNSGVGLWFAHSGVPMVWELQQWPEAVVVKDDKGRSLYGITASATIIGPELLIQRAVLSSVRVLREYQNSGAAPAEVNTNPSVKGSKVEWARDRLDGAAGYRLTLEVTHGQLQGDRIIAGRDGRIGVTIMALSGETPLTPLSGPGLLSSHAQADAAARNTLAFLSYQDKFLAGSWRFNTYFGRDTLMSVCLLMPALDPGAVEDGLNSVLARLSPTGEVAHEEDIGEFAILDHMRTDGTKSDAPVFDYKMIDANFMLAPVARAWLVEDPRGRPGAAPFLARQDGRYGGVPRLAGSDLVMNMRFVIRRAAAFAKEPEVAHLIGLKPGYAAGQWRDSNDGLGGGRYPYDVNAVLVPAALEAASRFYASGLLDPYLAADDRSLFSKAAEMARIWRERAPRLFEVEEPNEGARIAIKTYSAAVGVSPDAALGSIGQAPERFHALALQADGNPVPVVNSDEGFELLWGHPDPAALDEAVTAIMRPFPAGLLTDAGIVVANPVFASPELQARFTNHAYHGTVVWSWQQAMLAAALSRQLARKDLADSVRNRLLNAQRQLWRVIEAGKSMRNSELWSWTYERGQFRIVPFGASGADADESNAAQLWSTVYLGIPEPPLQ
jgi:hypothetical protein